MKQAELNKMFNRGVDGANSNLFLPVLLRLEWLIDTGYIKKTDLLTVEQLRKALKQVAHKQDKAIDKYLE